MADRVYKQEEIFLQDGKEVTLKPLVIGRLRRFMEAWEKGATSYEEGDDGYDVFINCCGIALEENFKGEFATKPSESEKKDGEFIGGEYKEYLLDTLDLDTIYRILLVCGGIDYPKLLKEMEKALAETKKVPE